MLTNLQKLSKDMIIFSVRVSDFEKPDFKDDALAGVRANFFNSNGYPQQDKSEINIFNKLYGISYTMRGGEPLAWKIVRNKLPYQTVKKLSERLYCVITYNEKEIIVKRQYFNSDHSWLSTEYFSNCFEGRLTALVYPDKIKDIVVLKYEEYSDGVKKCQTLFPSDKMPNKKCTALMYSNAGMLWFDSSFRPDEIDEPRLPYDKDGFSFKAERFTSDFSLSAGVDLFDSEFLDTCSEPVKQEQSELEADNSEEIAYSAYDKIEKILTEAHKTNKSLFGEVLIHTGGESEPSEASKDDLQVDCSKPQSASDDIADVPPVANEEQPDRQRQTDEPCAEEQDGGTQADLSDSEFDEPGESETDFETAEPSKCDMVIQKSKGRYLYYGELDGDNCRTGRGRTVNSNGITVYDGEYLDDKRNGFGVCYYKEGSINYVGSWSDGRRSGAGVGYRLSDNTMHVGCWSDNKPDGIGARFDSEGRFIDVSAYADGVRNGKSVAFDELGRVVIRYWSNGELVSERVIED